MALGLSRIAFNSGLMEKLFKPFTVGLIIAFLSLHSTLAQAQSQAPPLDIVFDLDWTLVNETNSKMASAVPENILNFDGHIYRFSDHTVDVLIALHKEPGVRISFFSGGPANRNQEIVRVLYEQIYKANPASNFKPYKILSSHDMTTISHNETLPFRERYRKNLAQHFNLNRTILVDDTKDFTLNGQERNQLWLGKTYNDRPLFELKELENVNDAKYSAPDFKEWKRDRNKLLAIKDILLQSIRQTRAGQGTFIQNVWKFNTLPKSCKVLF